MTTKEKFIAAYIEALFFADVPDEETCTADMLSAEAKEQIERDCVDFLEMAGELLEEQEPTKGGHDFWLTRQCHGCGFWDGSWPENGHKLTKMVDTNFSELRPYLGDDKLIYF